MKALLQKLSDSLAIWMLGIICAFAFLLMLNASSHDSAITDELAHIPAGYGYVHNLDYRLNPEHPPLIKTLAAFPLLFLNLNFPTQSSFWTTDVNGQWAMGSKFLYESGNDANLIVRWARLGPMLLTILLVVLIYVWSRELLGNWWALMPVFLFALSPTVLAHGHYVTTDLGAAFGIVLATYYFLKFLHEPSRRHLLYAGLAFGTAELLKFSAVLLIPYFLVLIAVFYLASVIRDWDQTEAKMRLKRFFIRGWNRFVSVATIFVIGYFLVVYPVYFLFTINYPVSRQAADTEFILGSFADGPTPASQSCHFKRCFADLDIWMSKHLATRPLAEYMLGVLMVLQRSSGGNTNYFLGEVSATGSHKYFPTVYFLKEPLPVLIMVFLALALSIRGIIKKAAKKSRIKNNVLDYLEINSTEFSMIVFVLLYWVWSIQSPLNIGYRHLLPTLPLIYILTAGVWKRWVMKINLAPATTILNMAAGWTRTLVTISLKYVLLVALLAWLFIETLLAAPYFLSYFNQLGGGIAGGYRYVTDSNYDWGQDLLQLQKFVATHPEVDKIAVDYFGGGNPKYYLGTKEEDWQSSRGNPADQGIHWLAVSVNTLQGAIQPLAPGQERNPDDEYRWLTMLRPPKPGLGNVPTPDFRAGTSIFIYKL